MKKKTVFLLFLLNLCILSGCQEGNAAESKNVENFSSQSMKSLKENANSFSNEEYQNGDVPLNEYVKITGVITKTDSDTNTIQNGDRFMIENDSYEYQVFNQQNTPLTVGDTVTVYGEYYGFVKGALIEKENSNDQSKN